MKNFRVFIMIITMLGLNGFARAGSNGGYAGAYLRTGLGARSVALGNAGLADEGNGYSFYYNPATTAFIAAKTFSLSYRFMSLDRQFNFIGYSMPVPPAAGFSIGWINAGVGKIQGTNDLGEFDGKIDHSINGAYFNFARSFGKTFAVGLSIKYLWESLDFGNDKYRSTGVGFDLGALYHINSAWTFAAAVRDLGSKLKANTEKLFEYGGTTIDRFPVLYLAGLRYQTPLKWLRILYDFEKSNQQELHHHLGAEAIYRNRVALRLGLNNANFTAGVGMRFKLYRYFSRLDYAFVPSVVDEGSSHIFSWQIYF